MILAIETHSFEGYLGGLWGGIFLTVINDDVSPDYSYKKYSAFVDERYFEVLLDLFGNLDAPL